MTVKIIAVANQKGGVGKTTTAVSISHGLARMGKEVLLIDLDPQGQAALSLGLKAEPGAYYLLTPPPGGQMTARDWIRRAREHLWLLPGDVSTNASQIYLNSSGAPINHIADALRPFIRNGLGLDFVVFDTAPSVGGIQERALWASDLVVVPAACEFLAADGVAKIFDMMIALQKEKEWSGKLAGVLPTFFDDRTAESKTQLAEYRRVFMDVVFDPIHRATALRECPGMGRTIFEMQANTAVTRAMTEYSSAISRILQLR
jgi:chromosome partitioning protein